MTLVHLTLSRDLLTDPVLLQRKADQIVSATGMVDVNERRLSRFAILTGSVEDDRIPQIEELQDVSIEVDSARQAAS